MGIGFAVGCLTSYGPIHLLEFFCEAWEYPDPYGAARTHVCSVQMDSAHDDHPTCDTYRVEKSEAVFPIA